jgi:alpha-tubulin suppressor-like RCC1 family protein
VHWHDKYYFAHGQKIATENLVYQLTDHAQALLLHPTRARIPFPTKLAGVSLGKYHNLAWDREGRLYSWGCRSIALGYAALPEEEVVEQPREAEQVRGHVIKAYAGSSYSLAVTLDGKLYEWGMYDCLTQKQTTPRQGTGHLRPQAGPHPHQHQTGRPQGV